jgi:toxin-antitoxin system PIN domain toxin
MTYLLDVNVLIALTDRSHIHHGSAVRWFEATGCFCWATCPITQNGFLRIVGNSRYRNSIENLATVSTAIKEFTALPDHVFWPDDVTLLDGDHVDSPQAITPNQVTDIYLMLLAKAHGGQLATFDRRIPAAAVTGANLLCLIGG